MLPLNYTDLLAVKDAEQLSSRAQTVTLSPAQQQQQTRQGLELQLHQVSQLSKLLVLNQVKCGDLQEGTNLVTLLNLITCGG